MPERKHPPERTPSSPPPRQRGAITTSAFDIGELTTLAPFSLLPTDALGDLRVCAKRHEWRARATALLNREFVNRIGVVTSGRVRLVAINADARPICLNELREGDLVGLCTNLVAINPGDNLRICIDKAAAIVSVSKAQFTRLMRAHSDFNGEVVQALARTVTDLHTRLFEVATLDVKARLAGRLLALASPPTHLAHRPIQVAHAVLAAEIGASREAVSRHLADLQKERLIKNGSRIIEILDRTGLEAIYLDAAGHRPFGPAGKI